MDFETSTQAKSWMFDNESLIYCKNEAAVIQSIDCGSKSGKRRVRNYACGFGKLSPGSKAKNGLESVPCSPCISCAVPTRMASIDQETLVHFHAHQIQRLVGPNPIFPELRRSSSVLSSAIMLFRRFYLSNSVIDYHPRNIAAASALLAVKVECEKRLEIDLLSHATKIVSLKAQKAPLCQEELREVSVQEIEVAERDLLSALDFRLRCHHPYGAIKVLSTDVAGYVKSCDGHLSKLNSSDSFKYSDSPKSVVHRYRPDHRLANLCERAIAVAQSALVYSDVNFLYPPGQIAFAAVAIAMEGNGCEWQLGTTMRNYLRMRFPQKNHEELNQYEDDVMDIVRNIGKCPEIDLKKFSSISRRSSRRATESQAAEVQRVFCVASYFRGFTKVTSSRLKKDEMGRSRKRLRIDNGSTSSQPYYKAARVTPIQTPYY